MLHDHFLAFTFYDRLCGVKCSRTFLAVTVLEDQIEMVLLTQHSPSLRGLSAGPVFPYSFMMENTRYTVFSPPIDGVIHLTRFFSISLVKNIQVPAEDGIW